MVVAAGGFGVLTRAGTDSLVLVLVGAGVLACGLVGTLTVGSELVLAAVTPEQAGSGSAVSEAGTELGGALGIALLGSIGAAAYRSFAGDHLPPEALHTPAAGSLPGALTTAAGMPGSLAEQVIAVGRDASVHGLHVAATAGAAVLLLAAVGLLISPRPTVSEPD
jgi:DHA2 family multidrug resistance protein-like MFS transporter